MLETASFTKRVLTAVVDAAPDGLVVRHGSRLSKQVALTFDDGPDEHTGELLDLLDTLRVRATFFLLGSACAKYPDGVRAIVARGHEVASHGYTHKVFPDLSPEALADELLRVDALLPPSTRARPLLRPPRGKFSPTSLARSARAGYTTVLWSIDSDDCRTTDPAHIEARVAASRGGEIVLLHEGEKATRTALPGMVAALRAKGLEPATVSELIG